ncbi:MAG: precorrin-2 C(20)-methyltransferase [Anaerolineae bacterium]
MTLSYKLTAVGLGPGDPELITVKGLRAIEAAQLIFTPRSQDGEHSLALRIAQPWLRLERQQVVELPLPMTRNPDQLAPAWQAAADGIAQALGEINEPQIQGVYLLLGDPLLYGTFTYIWAELAARHPHIAIEIIPGVTSFAAAAAQAKFPLSMTSDRVAILPASYETDAAQLRRLLADYETIILMKVGTVLSQILNALDELHLLDSALYAERIGMPEEFIATGAELCALRHQRRPYLSLLMVRREGWSRR